MRIDVRPLALALLLSACQPPTPTAAPVVVTRLVTETPAPTETPTATWLPLPVPSRTPTPTPTATLPAWFTDTAVPLAATRTPFVFITPTPEGTLRPVRTVALSVSVFIPKAGGINGKFGRMASGIMVRRGAAACGPSWPFGTIFLLPAWVADYDLPRAVVCLDRGGLVSDGHLDIALTGDVGADLETARAWGRRRVVCEVNP